MIDYSLNALYEVAGISKQGVWEHFRREQQELELIRRVINQVDKRREQRPGEGLESLYWQLEPEGMGRDKFCRIFSQLGYGIRKVKNPIRTTIPAHYVFDNLIEGRIVGAPNQVWQSDITYIKIGAKHYYLTFIMDVYTRKIVGYACSDHMRATANIKALKMAFSKFTTEELKGCVHHSDRGTQYTSAEYLKLLRSCNMSISMGNKAQDNAFAERINGTIKNEYLIPWALSSFKELKKYTRRAVNDYNTKRHHRSLGRCSPSDYEKAYWQLPAELRKLEVIRSENTPDYLKEPVAMNSIDTSCKYPYCALILN